MALSNEHDCRKRLLLAQTFVKTVEDFDNSMHLVACVWLQVFLVLLPSRQMFQASKALLEDCDRINNQLFFDLIVGGC